jgi:hypothetical protein
VTAALPLPARKDISPRWIRQWPRCVLLLQLTSRCAKNRRSQAGTRLLARIEDERVRMRGSPPQVEILLNELWYASTLIVQGDRAAAVHHAEEARRKARRVQDLISHTLCVEARRHASHLRRHSKALQQRTHELLAKSQSLLTRSQALQRRAAAVSSLP